MTDIGRPDGRRGRRRPAASKGNIQALVSAEVERRLTKEIQIIKDGVSLAIKIVGAAFALLIAVFTLFGITTWSDIKRETTKYIQTEASNLVQSSDSQAGVKQTLNELVNRTIVSSVLTARVHGIPERVELSRGQWDRLRNWIKLETLELDDFRDVLVILDSQQPERKKQDANQILADMLFPSQDSPYVWIAKQPEKRLAILQLFSHKDLGAAAGNIAASRQSSTEMRIAAAEYIRQVQYAEAFSLLMEVALSDKESPLGYEALLTCASLRPDDSGIAEVIENLVNRPSESNARMALRLVTLWGDTRNYVATNDNSQEVRDLSKKLLTFATSQRISFGLATDQRSSPRLSISDEQIAKAVRVYIYIQTSPTSGSLEFFSSIDAFAGLTVYWESLQEAADKSDLPGFAALMLDQGSGYWRPEIPLVRMNLTASAAILVKQFRTKNEIELTSNDEVEVFLSRSDTQSPTAEGQVVVPGVGVTWKDSNGQTFGGKVIGLSGQGFKLSMRKLNIE